MSCDDNGHDADNQGNWVLQISIEPTSYQPQDQTNNMLIPTSLEILVKEPVPPGEVLIPDSVARKGRLKGTVDRNIGRLDSVPSLVLKTHDILGKPLKLNR